MHRTIKTGLIVKKLEKDKNFNIELDLFDVINAYNNTQHNVIKATPNEVFFSTNINFSADAMTKMTDMT